MAASNRSATNASSLSTSSASSAARARAKAEAARVRASYASKEAQLKVEKVKIDTELQVLELQREADAAVAEAEVLEEAEAIRDGHESRRSESDRVKKERTCEYVKSQMNVNKHNDPAPVTCNRSVEIEGTFITWNPTENDVSDAEPSPVNTRPRRHNQHTSVTIQATSSSPKGENKPKSNQTKNALNPFSSPFVPLYNSPGSTSHAEPFAQYMARRDLITSGLYQYDDKPENFRAWLSSFTGATADVHLTPTQELDLMTKWLGKESSSQIKRIRSVYVNNPAEALQKAWDRLQECYAAPEIIEKSLFQRLDSFPKMTAKDNVKLRELGDLLQEIQGAKEDGYLPGLLYLDTSRGIRPIVDKLPYGIQEKWMSLGSQYKEDHHDCFPPFSYFCKFICKEAKRRNDPSFNQQNSQTQLKLERPNMRNFSSAKPISVNKTNITPPTRTLKATARCTISPTHSINAGHSGTNCSMKERPSSKRKESVSSAVPRTLISLRTANPQ